MMSQACVPQGFSFTGSHQAVFAYLENQIAEHGRDSIVEPLRSEIKANACDIIEQMSPKRNAQEDANEFETAWENACDAILEDEKPWRISLVSGESQFHDGDVRLDEIQFPQTKVVTSFRETGENKQYPMVRLENRYEIGTCPAQKYNFVCKHTLANVILQNMHSTEN